MHSIELIRQNLRRSRERVLAHIEDMRDHALVAPTPNGGGHTLWTLGHLAYIEGLVIHQFMLGGDNPVSDWQAAFDGAEVSADPDDYPPFDEVLNCCIEMRARSATIIDGLSEEDLDRESGHIPKGYEDTFGTYRLCLQYVSDHWYMHRGQLANARRAAGLKRMWV